MTIKNPDDIIIDKKLQTFKMCIYKGSNLSTKDQQSTSTEIQRDIINLDDIILPRRLSKVLYKFCDICNCF